MFIFRKHVFHFRFSLFRSFFGTTKYKTAEQLYFLYVNTDSFLRILFYIHFQLLITIETTNLTYVVLKHTGVNVLRNIFEGSKVKVHLRLSQNVSRKKHISHTPAGLSFGYVEIVPDDFVISQKLRSKILFSRNYEIVFTQDKLRNNSKTGILVNLPYLVQTTKYGHQGYFCIAFECHAYSQENIGSLNLEKDLLQNLYQYLFFCRKTRFPHRQLRLKKYVPID